ncbi:MAG: tRNA uridine-5-carboxymethylaminomethyl(34) synthesis GTPase MnmE [Gemmatimonadetes bacterium]|nr:tRNA uridine-5-carboxymethylaminomethyl(34) synthesis GTPase MnmE [Gemmatimonadota bacterium]
MLSDVIAAIATPPGRSALAVIRVSGRGAHAIAATVLRPFAVEPLREARLTEAVGADGEPLDRPLYVVYRGPASYTGEDVVEISTHGGLLVPAEVLAALGAAGARPAAPGEFTRRALQNGKLDLLQAEGVADMIDATAPAQRRAALSQMDRGLSARIERLREQVLEVEALVSYDIDFPEEDSGPVAPERIAAATTTLEHALEGIRGTARDGERLREGALAVIAGRPNAGKSSLFNALLGSERAIVTEIPGTTRDAIEAPAVCDGFPFRLVDTAGLRESEDRIERLGIEVSRKYLSAADLIVFCAESGRDLSADEEKAIGEFPAPVVLVRTKADVRGGGEGVAVSVHTGQGLAALRAELARAAFSSLAVRGDVAPVVTRARHRAALERALVEVRGFTAARRSGLEAAVAATHLRAAITALEAIIGVVAPDDVLGRVFATFCVGK